jgi:hypothetical protein
VPGSAWQTSSRRPRSLTVSHAVVADGDRTSRKGRTRQRLSDDRADHGEEQPGRTDAFDELALFVLVYRDGAWWLAAGLHTPDRRDVYR